MVLYKQPFGIWPTKKPVGRQGVPMDMGKKIRCLGNPFLAVIFGCVVLAGCDSTRPEIYIERPVEDIYNIAMDYLLDGAYQDAAKAFEEVERQHPYLSLIHI